MCEFSLGFLIVSAHLPLKTRQWVNWLRYTAPKCEGVSDFHRKNTILLSALKALRNLQQNMTYEQLNRQRCVVTKIVNLVITGHLPGALY